ncbi:MAG: hypothetical protein ACTSR2_00835 [Candidatus Hodarchaeales archaeon]
MKQITITFSKNEVQMLINALGCYIWSSEKKTRQNKARKLREKIATARDEQEPYEDEWYLKRGRIPPTKVI